MRLVVALRVRDGSDVEIELSGELDASSAPQFKGIIEQAAGYSPKRLFLNMMQLTYISSAGLRVLIFAKQKMGTSTDIYVVGAREAVAQSIKLTGFDRSIFLVEEIPRT